MAYRIKTRKDLISWFDTRPQELRNYFDHLGRLLTAFPLDVAFIYASARLELGQTMTLYGGLVKVHRANTDVARRAIELHHLLPKRFVDLYRAIFGFDLPQGAGRALDTALKARFDLSHGELLEDNRLRNAVTQIVEYAQATNEQLGDKYTLRPFGDLRGVSGRVKKLDRRKTRTLLRELKLVG